METPPQMPAGCEPRCPWCGQAAGTVAVHGHVQCAACGTNVDPCCGGETAREPDPA